MKGFSSPLDRVDCAVLSARMTLQTSGNANWGAMFIEEVRYLWNISL